MRLDAVSHGGQRSVADHHPPHVYLDSTWHMITASTLNRTPAMSGVPSESLFRSELRKLFLLFEMRLRA